MADETLELTDSFVVVAVRHQLLNAKHAEEIVDKAKQEKTDQADAALTLAYLTPQEVDAVQLLMRPDSFVPGYRLTGLIGCGAIGMVFRARQLALDRETAVKTINLKHGADRVGVERIHREARAIARLNHPNIVAAYDSGFYHGRFCIALELVDGEDLGTWIKRTGPLSEGMAWRMARQIAAGLAHANEAGIVHRDIKPANVLLTKPPAGSRLESGVPLVKVADFGLALEPVGKDQSSLTATGAALGTPAYVAPEQVQDTHVDARADIYALGATVFHMLTGAAPFSDCSPVKAILSKATGDDAWRAKLPNGLSRVTVDLFRSMTEFDRARRIGSHELLIDRIDELLLSLESTDQSSAPSSDRPPQNGSDRRSRESLFFRGKTGNLAFAALLLLAAAVSWGVWANLSGVGSSNDAPGDVSVWDVQGAAQHLFDGLSVPIYPQSGSWSVDSDFTLAADENAWMKLPLERRLDGAIGYRFQVSVMLGAGSSVQIVLPHPVSSGSIKNPMSASVLLEKGTARVVPTEATSVAGRRKVEGTKKVNLRPDSPDEKAAQEVHVYRQADVLILIVNGMRVAQFTRTPATEDEITLKVVRGRSSFADIAVDRLVEPRAVSQAIFRG